MTAEYRYDIKSTLWYQLWAVLECTANHMPSIHMLWTVSIQGEEK